VEGAHHFYLQKGIVAVVEEILGLAAVDANDTQEELAAETEGHELDLLAHDGVDGLLDVGLERLRLRELALHVGGEPYPAEGPSAGQDGL
jgi:hypothetical protein